MTQPASTLVTNRYQAEAISWLTGKAIFDSAKEALADRKDDLVGALSEDDGPYVIVKTPIGAVALTDKDRRTFDASKLGALVNIDKLIEWGVIEYKVNPEAFDKAVEEGKIKAPIVTKVTDSTPYVDVRKHSGEV